MALYAVSAEVVNNTRTRSIPTFLLDEDVLGIISEEHAEKIAKKIVDPFDEFTVFVCAVKLSTRNIVEKLRSES